MNLKSKSQISTHSDNGRFSAAANQSDDRNMGCKGQGDYSSSLFKNDLTPTMINHNDIGTHSNYDKYLSRRNVGRTGSLIGIQTSQEQHIQAASLHSYKAYSQINSVNTAM